MEYRVTSTVEDSFRNHCHGLSRYQCGTDNRVIIIQLKHPFQTLNGNCTFIVVLAGLVNKGFSLVKLLMASTNWPAPSNAPMAIILWMLIDDRFSLSNSSSFRYAPLLE